MKVILKDNNNYDNFSIIPETDFEKSFLEKFMEFGDIYTFRLYPYFGENIRANFVKEYDKQ